MESRVLTPPALPVAALRELLIEDGLAIEDPRSVLPSRTGETLIGAGSLGATARSHPRDGRVKPGDLLLGKYQVLNVLGRGATSYVVSAWHANLGCELALKFLEPSLADKQEAGLRLTFECRNNWKLHSELIVRMLDVDVLPDGQPFLVMERLHGYNLRAALDDGVVLSPPRALTLVLQACEALASAHAIGLCHGNLKPQHLFCMRHPQEKAEHDPATRAQLKLLALGRSRETYASTHRVTTLNAHAASLYLSPEQLRGGAAGASADLWALGCILYEMLSGRALYRRPSLARACAAVLEERAPSLRGALPSLPVGLDQVLRSCLAKDPEQRPANVAQLAQELAPFAPARARRHARACAQVFEERGLWRSGAHRQAREGSVGTRRS